MRATKISKILVTGLLFVVVLVPVMSRRDHQAIQEKLNAECVFPDSELPNDFAVYAAGGYRSIWVLDFPIDRSGNMADRMDLVVNSPSKPVVLMLGRSDPTIYNIKWTEGTDIMAVVATGYYRQAVAGLPEETPVLISTYSNGAKCGYFSNDPDIYGYEEVDSISEKLLGRPVDKIKVEHSRPKWIGEPTEDKDIELLTSDDTTIDSFYDPTLPLPGQAGITAALKKGTLRRATRKDAEAWMELQQRLHPEKDVSIISTSETFPEAYVVKDNFAYPGGLGGANAVLFFVPEDVSDPNGDPGHSAIYNFKTGKCSGGLCNW